MRQEIVYGEESVGWTVTFQDKTSDLISSGTASSYDLALKKAFFEFIERSFLSEANVDHSHWKFDLNFSTDCMAAGYSLNRVIERSNQEAAERYLRGYLGRESVGLVQFEQKKRRSINKDNSQ